MLAGLARWLRAAGYDTELATAGARDGQVLDLAESRTLLTRDRSLAALAGRQQPCLLIRSETIDSQAVETARALGLDWTRAPFTRCMIDNSLLERADERTVARMPEAARKGTGPFRICPQCGRLYWPGSHVKRMLSRLERWRAAARPRARFTAPF
jgi:uncharacterized protein with PIN domain